MGGRRGREREWKEMEGKTDMKEEEVKWEREEAVEGMIDIEEEKAKWERNEAVEWEEEVIVKMK